MIFPANKRVMKSLTGLGEISVLAKETFLSISTLKMKWNDLLYQIYFIGVKSQTVVLITGAFTGMVLGAQTYFQFHKVKMDTATLAVVGVSMCDELGPVLTALMVAGRVGAAIAAELGTMRVNEEIDALYTLGISPIRYLAMPRFVGCVTMLPILVVYASIVGMFGGAIIASAYFDMTFAVYFKAAFKSLDMSDVGEGLLKALLFGAIVAVVSIHRGLSTRGGAEGVGRAITSCVVTCFIWIIIGDYFVTRFMM